MNPTGTPPPPLPPPPQPPASSGRKVLFIVLGIIGLIGLVICVVSAYVAYRLKNSELGRNVGEMVQAAAKGQQAPGAQALRDRGCTQAHVMDMRPFLKAALEATDAGAELTEEDLPPGMQVTCRVPEGSPLGCDEVAKIYAEAAKPTAHFTVAVLPGPEASCTEAYTAAGERRQMPDYEGELEGEPVDDFQMGDRPAEGQQPPPGATPPPPSPPSKQHP
jgi:hypothetical protein